MSEVRALALRALPLGALGLLGAERWGGLVAPAARGPMVLALAESLLAALGIRVTWRLGPRSRRAAAAGILLLLLALDLRAAGVPRRLLAPARWDDLAAGIGQGLGGLPDATSPYDGVDEWVRRLILLGGALLLGGGALLALAARAPALGRRAAAVVPMIALATVPAVILRPGGQVGEGVALFGLMAGVLWLERLRSAQTPAALALLLLAGVGGTLAASALHARRPWLAYEGIARSLGPAAGERFDWAHSYGPIDWPRDGREVLRVHSSTSVYLKAENLDSFDGLRWLANPANGPGGTEEARSRGWTGSAGPRWHQSLGVIVRGLRTRDVIGAGATLAVRRAPYPLVPGPSPGTWRSSQELRPGDSYAVDVYAPQPRPAELAAAGTEYPAWTAQYRVLGLPRRAAGGALLPGGSAVALPRFGLAASPLEPLLHSPYAQAYELARVLAARAATPYDFARLVQRHLGHGFVYSETPPRRPVPLESFLIRDRRGYCQQFSGTMALLLRLGGVPARVAAGFTPGTPSGNRGERVVRDYDAHSWVEAWFPRFGWVTFDPTPAASPALSANARIGPLPGTGGKGGASTRRRQPDPLSGASPAPAPPRHGGAPVVGVALGAAALLLLAGLLLLARRRRRARDPLQIAVFELERALRRTGRASEAATTLQEIEQRLRGAPQAAAYVRALRDARYGYGEKSPSAAQRRALREELARGRGAGGRLRAWWALPPQRGSGPVRRERAVH